MSNEFPGLTPGIISKAVDLSETGVDELAFPVAFADEILQQLVEAGKVVLGGDLWRLISETGKMSPTYRNWYIELPASPSEAAATARKYIRGHAAPDDFIVFVI